MLILALVYIIAIGLIVGALADWAMNDLNNTTHFRSSSSLDYAASSAAQVAIQSIRYAPEMPATQSPSLSYCWTPPSGYISELSENSYTIGVWCSTVQNLASARTRVVTFYVCPTALTSSSSSAAVLAGGVACQNKALLTVQVAYDDYLPGQLTLKSTCDQLLPVPHCGSGAKIEKWIWA